MDIALGNSWPARYTGRSLRNPFLDKWWDKEDDLTADQRRWLATGHHVRR